MSFLHVSHQSKYNNRAQGTVTGNQPNESLSDYGELDLFLTLQVLPK